MGAEGAVNILYRDELAKAEDPAEERRRLVAELQREVREPVGGGELGYLDDVIEPQDTRPEADRRARDAARQAAEPAVQEARQPAALRRRFDRAQITSIASPYE